MKLKPEKNSGLNGIQTHDLCSTGAVFQRLSYQAIWELVTLWVYLYTCGCWLLPVVHPVKFDHVKWDLFSHLCKKYVVYFPKIYELTLLKPSNPVWSDTSSSIWPANDVPPSSWSIILSSCKLSTSSSSSSNLSLGLSSSSSASSCEGSSDDCSGMWTTSSLASLSSCSSSSWSSSLSYSSSSCSSSCSSSPSSSLISLS